ALLGPHFENIAKTLGRDQSELGAAAFDDGVGDQRGAVDDLADVAEADARGLGQLIEADQRGLGRIMRRRQPLVQPNRAGGAILENEIRECAADIEADAPGRLFVVCRHFFLRRAACPYPRSMTNRTAQANSPNWAMRARALSNRPETARSAGEARSIHPGRPAIRNRSPLPPCLMATGQRGILDPPSRLSDAATAILGVFGNGALPFQELSD